MQGADDIRAFIAYIARMQIDHDPHERRMTNIIWWVLWPMIGLLWIGTWYFFELDWHQIALGVGTGVVLAAWAIEITGDKLPESMRPRDAPRRR